MARRQGIQRLSSFSWQREAEISAARQRLSGRTVATPVRSRGHRAMWRVLGWSLTLAVIAAILCAIVFKFGWLGIIRLHHGLAAGFTDVIPFRV